MGMLTGVTVLDLSTVIAAPFAAGLMADFGAEVIKIEMPNGGDPFRRLGPFHGKDAMRFACMGRNKKSVTLDLRTEKGKEMFLKMVEKTDVIIENFRTGTLDKWGIGYDKMKEANILSLSLSEESIKMPPDTAKLQQLQTQAMELQKTVLTEMQALQAVK